MVGQRTTQHKTYRTNLEGSRTIVDFATFWDADHTSRKTGAAYFSYTYLYGTYGGARMTSMENIYCSIGSPDPRLADTAYIR